MIDAMKNRVILMLCGYSIFAALLGLVFMAFNGVRVWSAYALAIGTIVVMGWVMAKALRKPGAKQP